MSKQSGPGKGDTEINTDQKQNDQREAYMKRCEYFTRDFKKKCEEEKVPAAVVMLIDPESPDAPIIYIKGGKYNEAVLACQLAKYLKTNLMHSDELTV